MTIDSDHEKLLAGGGGTKSGKRDLILDIQKTPKSKISVNSMCTLQSYYGPHRKRRKEEKERVQVVPTKGRDHMLYTKC